MNEYKKLIAILRDDEFCESLDYKHYFYVGNAADAIERLMKERDDFAEVADEWQHDYFELVGKTEQLKRERDAAVDDLEAFSDCTQCKHYKKSSCCEDCNYDYSKFEWRGVKENNI